MPVIYVDANPSYIAYVIDGGGSDYQQLPPGKTIMEAEYLAIMYGLSEFYLKWQQELDARQYDGDNKVATPSQQTPRALPPPICIRSDNEVAVKQLSRQYHIAAPNLRKLAQNIWDMTKNLEVKFEWIPRKENVAGKMLP